MCDALRTEVFFNGDTVFKNATHALGFHLYIHTNILFFFGCINK